MIPREVKVAHGYIIANEDRNVRTVEVVNNGDRPIQIGSHYHFYEVHNQLEFNRRVTFGYHLNIPAGTVLRFEPGDKKTVELVTFGGEQELCINFKTNGPIKERI